MRSQNRQNPSMILPNTNSPKLCKQLGEAIKSSKKSNKKRSSNNCSKNKPLKVVYISNPKKFQVNADEFQALVQGLTGRDATEWTDDLAQDVSPTHGRVQHDEIQQAASMDDDQVQVDGYDGSPSETSIDYFGPLNGNIVFGDEEKEQMVYYDGFPSFYD